MCMSVYISADFSIHLRKLIEWFSYYFKSRFSFWLPRIPITIENKSSHYYSYFLFEILPEANSQFTFFLCCLAVLKVKYPFWVWLCYTRRSLETQLIIRPLVVDLLFMVIFYVKASMQYVLIIWVFLRFVKNFLWYFFQKQGSKDHLTQGNLVRTTLLNEK